MTEPTPGLRQTLRVQLGIRGRRLWRDVPGSPARATETVRSGA